MNHSFNVKIAAHYSVDIAIIVQNFDHWLTKNAANNRRNEDDGKPWTYNSVSAFSEIFPYWTQKQVRRVLDNCMREGIIQASSFNKHSYDRTKWYRFTDSFVKEWAEHLQCSALWHLPEQANESCPNGQIHLPKQANEIAQTGQPIPDINTDINTDTNQMNVDRPAKRRAKRVPDLSLGEFGNVRLTTSEHDRLREQHGESMISEAVELLSIWKEEKGRRVLNDNLAIRRWVIDAVVEKRRRLGKPAGPGPKIQALLDSLRDDEQSTEVGA